MTGGDRVAAEVVAYRKTATGGAALAGCFPNREEAKAFAEEANAREERGALPWRTRVREEGGADGRR